MSRAGGGRLTVEAVGRKIALADLTEAGLLRRRTGTMLASWGDETVMIEVAVGDRDGELRFSHAVPGNEKATEARYVVRLVTTPQPFGGHRWWLRCPVTGRRCLTLYRPWRAYQFASRQAYRLGYGSARETATWRALNRSHKLRKRLDPETEWADPIPDRPCGMHWSTYERRVARIEALERAGQALLVPTVERILRMTDNSGRKAR